VLKTIVVPLDGSELSESVLPVARDLAHRLGAGVALLTTGWGSTADELQAYLSGRAEVLGEIPVAIDVVADRFPAPAIVEAVDVAPDGGVVMATHGRSGFGKALLGSVAEDVLKDAHRPVLLLGPKAEPRPGLGDGELVMCFDGSHTSISIVPTAIEWAAALGLTIVVITVAHGDGTVLGSTERIGLDQEVEGIIGRVRSAGIEVRHERLEGNDAAKAVVGYASAPNVALIALATHGRTGMARTALGSVAMKIVHTAVCPVLVVRPAD